MDDAYIKLLNNIINHGEWITSRNSRTLQIPFYSFSINYKDWRLSLRKMYYKGVEGEFKTLIDPTPLTHVSQFEANGCNYWHLWASEETGALRLAYHEELHPQLEDVIEQIKNNPFSRRNLVSLWNHKKVKDNVYSLPPCWEQMIFVKTRTALDVVWINRSLDVYFGLPADVYLAHLFLKHVSEATDIPAGKIHFTAANVHLYENQVDAAKQMLDGKEPDYKPELME